MKKKVAIIGAGPAGIAAATEIMKIAQVDVFESGTRLRDKACGDLFIPPAVEILTKLGLDVSHFRKESHVHVCFREFKTEVSLLGDGIFAQRAILDQQFRDLIAEKVNIRYENKVVEVSEQNTIIMITSMKPDGSCSNEAFDLAILANGHHRSFSSDFGIAGYPDLHTAVRVSSNRSFKPRNYRAGILFTAVSFANAQSSKVYP